MTFHFIASTGRSATTWLASRLDRHPDIIACHEGYRGMDKSQPPLLPLINLENAAAYRDPAVAAEVVAEKRDAVLLENAAGGGILVDVAYYNSVLAPALLGAGPRTRMVGILRDCESFVRSATTVHGEDPMPVGWPDQRKPLTPRERFISLGRLRPRPGTPDATAWRDFSAVMKNIWLWRETNLILAGTAEEFGERVRILDFALVREAPDRLIASILEHFGAGTPPSWDVLASGAEEEKAVNRKSGGYQIGPATDWTEQEQRFMSEARALVKERMKSCRT